MRCKTLEIAAAAASLSCAVFALASSPYFSRGLTRNELAQLVGGQAPCQCQMMNLSCNTDCVPNADESACTQCKKGRPYANCVSCPQGVTGLMCTATTLNGQQAFYCGSAMSGTINMETQTCDTGCPIGGGSCIQIPNLVTGANCPSS